MEKIWSKMKRFNFTLYSNNVIVVLRYYYYYYK